MKLRFAFAALAVAGCAGSDADFHVHFTPDAPRRSATVSIVGVYRDGRFATESWATLGGPLSATFSGLCSPGYDEALLVNDPSLSAAVDDYTRANGPTDSFLEAIAPAAEGDLLVVFSVSGHPEREKVDLSSPNGTPLNNGPSSTPMRGGRMHGMAATSVPMHGPTNAYEISVSLYSKTAKQSVGFVAMEYTGHSGDEALKDFVERLRAEIPGDSCAGWSWKGKVDASKIEAIKDG